MTKREKEDANRRLLVIVVHLELVQSASCPSECNSASNHTDNTK